MRALVVEDNAGIRDVVVDLLTRRGHDVAAFADAESAWEATRHEVYPVAVLDWGLPGMDGIELCRMLRARPGGEAGAILILTGRADPEDIDEVVAAGADDYLTKPFKLDWLEVRIAFAERKVADLAERARTAEALRRSEARFRSLVEQTPAITYLQYLDRARGLIYLSPRVETVLGWTADAWMADPGFWLTILHPDDVAMVMAAEERAEATQEPYYLEYRQRRPDGRYVWVRDEAHLLRDEDGCPLYWQGVLFDVTAQRELLAAAERQATEQRLLHEVRSALARELEVPVVLRVVVEAMARTFGYTLVSAYLIEGDELVLQHQVGYPRVVERIPVTKGVVGRVARTGDPVLLTDATLDPDFLAPFEGLVSEVCVPLRDEGRVVGILNLETSPGETLNEADLALMIALAEHVETAIGRARLYTAARESEQRYRTVVESVQEVIFQTDAAGNWTFLNPAWTEITGYPIAETLGRQAASFVHPDDRDRCVQGLARMMTRELADGRSEVRFLTVDGDVRTLDVHARGTLDADGRIIGVSGTLTDVTERRRAEEALRESQERFRHLALHDPLTGLPNRALFLDRLEHGVASAVRHRSGLGVLFLDLDGFKLVNDSLGHDAGDRLLVAVVERLSGSLRAVDTVARLGGDEFAILLEDNVDTASADLVARRLLEAMRPPFLIDGQEIAVGASIGVALGTGGEVPAADLLRNADIALYEAKGAGRATYALYEPRMATTVLARLQQETDLRWAIDRGELRVHYQPVFDLRSSELRGVEALIRWQHPELGLLPPAEFIRAAEANGLVVPLGDWVLREACRAGRRWQDLTPAAAPVVAVNLSARQLLEPGLAASVVAALAESGLAPDLLELEITESTVMMDGAGGLRTLAELRALGVRLAIDDFGTGYASLSYLRDIPIDVVKVDRSFVAGVGRDRSSLAIVRAITTLAHDLGLLVTAEGIETMEQQVILRSLGVDRGQGYYFARPLADEGIDPLLESGRPGVVSREDEGARQTRAAVVA